MTTLTRYRIDASPSKRLKCVALATGMKCLPQHRIHDLQGNVVHDSHAEILALRAFNRFLLDCCVGLAAQAKSITSSHDNHEHQGLVEWRTPTTNKESQPFQINPRLKIHMYCSEAPCGDASMELTIAAQQDAAPWSRTPDSESAPSNSSSNSSPLGIKPNSSSESTSQGVKPNLVDSSSESIPQTPKPEVHLYGRSYFDLLGVVRRKPSRPDASPTLSKSCSDKLALKQCTSTLSSITSMLIHPGNAYISTLIMPDTQYIDYACDRAFGPRGRMAPLLHAWDEKLIMAGYSYTPFTVMPTTREFVFSRRAHHSADPVIFVPSNLSTLAYGLSHETLINGVLQGRKQADPKGASAVSRRNTWSLALSIADDIGNPNLHDAFSKLTYAQVKSGSKLRARELSKDCARSGPLEGWSRNTGDDNWSL